MKTLDEILDEVNETSPIWSVYELVNETTKQVYYGTTRRTVAERVKEHSKDNTKAIYNWDWEKDDIMGCVVEMGLEKQPAIDTAQRLESTSPYNSRGYQIIQTGGA